MVKNWLRQCLEIQFDLDKPFVHINDELFQREEDYYFNSVEGIELVSCMKEGDELWHFKSPPNTWKMHAGREGIALVSKGEIIDYFVIRRN